MWSVDENVRSQVVPEKVPKPTVLAVAGQERVLGSPAFCGVDRSAGDNDLLGDATTEGFLDVPKSCPRWKKEE